MTNFWLIILRDLSFLLFADANKGKKQKHQNMGFTTRETVLTACKNYLTPPAYGRITLVIGRNLWDTHHKNWLIKK
jgi:hypothetical protein